MGRPLKRTSELRKRPHCYLSSDGRMLVEAKAIEAGLSVSSFVRGAVLSRRIMKAPIVSAQQWTELGRVCSNLNQLARHLNAGTANGVPPELIGRLYAQVQEVRRALLGACVQ